jgi:hypothetical protein
MRKVHTTALVGEDGILSLEVTTDLAPGEHRLTLLVDEQTVGPEAHTATRVRQELSAFLEGWDAPGMSAYDDL